MFSLKWKALIGLTLLLFVVNSSLGYLGYLILQKQLQEQLDLTARRFSNSFNHMLDNNKRILKNISDSIAVVVDTTPSDSSEPLKVFFDRHWQPLQGKWGLEATALLDVDRAVLGSWGTPLPTSTLRVLATLAQQKSAAVSNFHCESVSYENACALMTAIPLTGEKTKNRTLILSMSVANLIADLARDNFLNTALMIQGSDADSESVIGPWDLTLVASSDRDATLALLQSAARSLNLKQLENIGAEIQSKDGRYFYIRSIGVEAVYNESDVRMFLIDDITAQRAALSSRILQVIGAAALGMLMSEIALLVILWQPMERIKWQSKVLPLLADGDYQSVHSWPGNRNIKYRDELDVLEDASITLAQRLEKMSLEIRRRARELEYIALFDELTGLANRRSFEKSLSVAISDYARTQRGFAVLFIDLDNFKRINDSLGHKVGDDLLIEVAHRLTAVTRVGDTVARLGGDEFIMLLPQLGSGEAVIAVADKILQALHAPLLLGGRQMHVTGSIGAALAPEHGLDIGTLMKNADLAMYRAKALGRNTCQIFTDLISDSAERLLDMEIELARALEQRQFMLFYQPIVKFPQRRVVGLEALVRWKHPTRGLVDPGEFIPLMEKNGMVTELDRQVVAMACRDLRLMQHEADPTLTLSVNLSAHQLRDTALVEFLRTQIELAEIDPKYLKLEVTESALMEDVDHAAMVLTQLKGLGVKLSIDDFGTGYSSLNYLKKLPVDEIKVDRSFVSDIPNDKTGMEIVAAVIAMAHKLNLSVVAEGIETEQQIAFLLSCDCDLGQGYLFQRPAARVNTVAWLRKVAAENTRQLRQSGARA